MDDVILFFFQEKYTLNLVAEKSSNSNFSVFVSLRTIAHPFGKSVLAAHDRTTK